MSNMSMNMAMQNMMNHNWSYRLNYVVNEKYIFTVAFKDGSSRVIESKIYPDTTAHSNYLLMINKNVPKKDPAREQKIYPKETLKISRADDSGQEIIGNANDTCWLFKVMTGKINAYSYVSETEGINTFYLSAFQTGDGVVQKLTPEALEPILKSDEKAYKAFLKKDYYTAIKRYNKDNK
ncbi:MAG: hypothetical protein JWP37_4418 [Mucilaginibacter sp.]|nr:hypothetical protein [Mucilaginibacter sp.]